MTNEKAKKIIFQQWQEFLEHNIDYAGISDAYRMAIKALEQTSDNEYCRIDGNLFNQALDETIASGLKALEQSNAQNTLEPNDDCISREQTAQFIENHLPYKASDEVYDAYRDCVAIVKDKNATPPVTPARIRGKWIHGHCNKDDYIKCSTCDKEIVQNIVTLEGDMPENVFNLCPYCGSDNREAADTIEQLSAKLHAANMERSSQYYHGGWIPVSERLPEENERDLDYMVTVKCDTWEHSEVMSMVWETTVVRGKKVSRWKWRGRNVPSGWNVIAWQPRPREYRGE